MHRPQRRDVLEAHLRRPVLADRDAAVRADQADVGTADRRHPDEVVRARQERRERGRERHPAAHLKADGGRDQLLLGDVHLEVPLRDAPRRTARCRSSCRPRRRARRSARPRCRARPAPRRSRGGSPPSRPPASSPPAPPRSRTGAACAAARNARAHGQVAQAAELADRRLGIGERLAVEAVAVLDRAHALALDRARDDRDRLPVAGQRLLVGAVDLVEVVAVDLDRPPAERLRPPHIRGGVPAEHRLAALAEPVHVDDRDQVVEASRGLRGRRPPRSSPPPSRCRRRAPTPGTAPGPGASPPARPRRRRAGPDRASRSPRRPRESPASDGPRAGSRASGTSAARRPRSRPRPCTASRAAATHAPWRRSGGRSAAPPADRSRSAGTSRAAPPSDRPPTSTRSDDPEPAAAAARTESTRNCWPSSPQERMCRHRAAPSSCGLDALGVTRSSFACGDRTPSSGTVVAMEPRTGLLPTSTPSPCCPRPATVARCGP